VGREVRRTLHGVSTRREQRRRMVHMLALAQGVLALAVIPGYISPQPEIASLAALGAAVVVSLLSLAASKLFNNVTAAVYILVFGGGLAALAHLALMALAGDLRATDQAALFFLPMILEGAVFFAAEVTLVLMAISATLTAAALFFALWQGGTAPTGEIYLLVVYALSLQALVGLISWLVAQFLFESGSEAQRAGQFRMTQAQLETLQVVQARQQQQLRSEILALQDAITRVLSGAYVARVDVVPGELADLMQSFNLLLERIHALVGSGQGRDTTSELVEQMLILVGEITEGNTSVTRGVDPHASGPLGPVMQALLHLQARSANRAARTQELVSEVAGAVQTGLDGLGNTTEDAEAATRLAGKLVAAADQLAPSVKSSHALVLHARDLVGKLLPPALVQAAAQDAVHRDASRLSPAEAAKLLGRNGDLDGLDGLDVLDGGVTGEFEAVRPLDDGANGGERPDPAIPPLTLPLPAITLGSIATTQSSAPGEVAGAAGETQAQLLELWRMLDRLAATLANQYRTLRSISRELGKLSRSVRSADAGIVHGRASLDAARQAVKDLQDVVRPNRAPTYEPPTSLPRRPVDSAPPPPAERPSAAHVLGLGSVDSAPGGVEGDGGQLDVRQLIDPDVFDTSSANGPRRKLSGPDDSSA
jgi:methyl-accepting chemotaxis protein